MARATTRAHALSDLLPPELREVVKRQDLRLPLPVWGTRHGAHRSARPGVGQDFRDHRPYAPGDDLRRLDWRAAGRAERLVIRRTESEDELTVTFAVDASGGMAYGAGDDRKFAAAGAIVAALASVAARQGDPIGFALGRDGAVESRAVRPQTGRARLRELADALTRPPGGICPWEDLLAELAPTAQRKSLFVVVSDFLDPAAPGEDAHEADERLLRMLTRLRAGRHHVVLVQVLHDDELTFPWTEARVLRIEDLRGLREPVEGPGPSLRTRYMERLAAHQARLEASCERRGLHLHRVVAGRPIVPAFLGLLARLSGAAAQAPEAVP